MMFLPAGAGSGLVSEVEILGWVLNFLACISLYSASTYV